MTQFAEARTKQESDARERSRLANIEAAKQRLLVQAQANEVQEAQASLRELQTSLPPDNAFITTDAPKAIGSPWNDGWNATNVPAPEFSW